jgi:xanthine/CO dehydrogenase XdhC/CoxF family maturation factor
MIIKSTKPQYYEDDVIAIVDQWLAENRNIVFKTWGSSPLPTDSQLLIDDNYTFAGSVSGACIEGAIIEEAQIVL